MRQDKKSNIYVLNHVTITQFPNVPLYIQEGGKLTLGFVDYSKQSFRIISAQQPLLASDANHLSPQNRSFITSDHFFLPGCIKIAQMHWDFVAKHLKDQLMDEKDTLKASLQPKLSPHNPPPTMILQLEALTKREIEIEVATTADGEQKDYSGIW